MDKLAKAIESRSFGFYGKTALQFFNFLFVLKLIEPEIKKGHFQSIKNCLYSEFLHLYFLNLKYQYILLLHLHQ